MGYLVFHNAKINLGLQIRNKRDDGYHNIESYFVPITVKDVLEFVPTDTSELTYENLGQDIPGDFKDNLCFKAYDLLKEKLSNKGGKLYMFKNIPMGAGLGGGSADGTFMLKLLNDYFELGLSVKSLEDYSLKLGSDCPFFVKNEGCLIYGRGEVMEKFSMDFSSYELLVVNPGLHIGTKEAYAGVVPNDEQPSIKTILSNPIENWKDSLNNDFEYSILKKYTELSDIKQVLYSSGAIYASMTGSGSTMFGIYKKCTVPENVKEFNSYWNRKAAFI